MRPSTARRKRGDRVRVDFTGTIDGVEFAGGQAKDFPIVLGEGRMLPEFETAVTGMKAGETKSFELTFPADYHGREVAARRRSSRWRRSASRRRMCRRSTRDS